jgi:hypothetical protein
LDHPPPVSLAWNARPDLYQLKRAISFDFVLLFRCRSRAWRDE